MDDVTTLSVWGTGANDGSMSPQYVSGGQANNWLDVLATGLSGAVVNAAYNASNTVGAPPVNGITIGASGNLMPLLMIGALVWFVLQK